MTIFGPRRQPRSFAVRRSRQHLHRAWGGVIVCEDGCGDEFVHGVTQGAAVYKIARNALGSGEFAGSCFSPDGSALFVNIQSPGITLAITVLGSGAPRWLRNPGKKE